MNSGHVDKGKVDLSAGDKYIDIVRALGARIANRTDCPRWNDASFFKRFAKGATDW